MNKSIKKWSLFLIPLTTLGIIGAVYLTSGKVGSEAVNITDDSQQIAYVSVWDKETEGNYAGTVDMTVYRSPSCGCCGVWVEHAKKHGFQIKDIQTEQMEALKEKYNVPPELASCHTTIIDGYVMEGHIPADDIKRFLQEKPSLVGLAVPGMPLGTPGMEAGETKQPFQVLAFNDKGEVEVFNEYQSY
ncbi:MAG: hypothetical protein Tsb0014_36630 [Pleurocapsa sp.]